MQLKPNGKPTVYYNFTHVQNMTTKSITKPEESSKEGAPQEVSSKVSLILGGIKEFVEDIYELHKDSHVQLYKRMLERTSATDDVLIENCFSGFLKFFHENDARLTSNKISEIPKDSRITFGSSKTMFIPIGEYLATSSPQNQKNIVDHLLILSELLEHSKEKLRALRSPKQVVDQLAEGTSSEDKMLSNIFSKIQSAGIQETADPVTSVTTLFANGTLKEIFEGAKESAANGINKKKLLHRMKDMLGQMADSLPDD